MSGEGLNLKGIVRRFERDGRIIRVLKCDHEQVEPRGGRAKTAAFAQCGICNAKPAAEVLGACTAIKLNAAGVCGKPAKYTKRGQPRCGYHYHRGAR